MENTPRYAALPARNHVEEHTPLPNEAMVVTCRLSCGSKAEATGFARVIAREQTVEVPPGV